MARRPTEQEEIQRLIRISSQAREQLGGRIASLRRGFNLPARALRSMRHSPKVWLFGSMGAGLVTSLLLRKSHKGKKSKRSLRMKLLALGLAATRPMIKKWAMKQGRSWASNWLKDRLSPPPSRAGASPFQIEPDDSIGPSATIGGRN